MTFQEEAYHEEKLKRFHGYIAKLRLDLEAYAEKESASTFYLEKQNELISGMVAFADYCEELRTEYEAKIRSIKDEADRQILRAHAAGYKAAAIDLGSEPDPLNKEAIRQQRILDAMNKWQNLF